MTVSSSLTWADIAAFGTLGFAAVSWGVSQLITAFKSTGETAAAEAVTDATVATELKAMRAEIAALTTQITKTNDNHVTHEVDCAKFRGETVTELRNINRMLDGHGRAIGQLQSQIRLAITGGANKAFEVPADT